MNTELFGNISDSADQLLTNTWFQVALTIVATLIAQLIVRSTISHIIKRLVRSRNHQSKSEEKKRENTLISIVRTTAAVLLWVTAVIIILTELKVNIAALMTGAGVLGIVIGFGAQSSIKDFLAGMFIILENQYRVGDVVMLNGPNGINGVVEDITIRITKLRDFDGNLHIVSNGTVQIVTNMTFEFANVNIDLNVSYKSDIDKVEKIINQVGESIHQDKIWASSIVEPIAFLRVDNFGDSSITVKAYGKVKPAKQWDVAGEFRRRIKTAFEQDGIEMPLPQLVIREGK